MGDPSNIWVDLIQIWVDLIQIWVDLIQIWVDLIQIWVDLFEIWTSVLRKWVLQQSCCSPMVFANCAISRSKSIVFWMSFFVFAGFVSLKNAFPNPNFSLLRVSASTFSAIEASVATCFSVFFHFQIFSLLEFRVFTSSRNPRNKSFSACL